MAAFASGAELSTSAQEGTQMWHGGRVAWSEGSDVGEVEMVKGSGSCVSDDVFGWRRRVDGAEKDMLAMRGLRQDVDYEKRRILVDAKQGVEINTLSAGDVNAPPLVLLHGWGQACGFFFNSITALAKQFRVYAPDWHGMGASTRTPHPTSMDSIAAEEYFISPFQQWLCAVRSLDRIEQQTKVSLVAHSLGGYLAACFAIQCPQQVRNLVLVSPIGLPKVPNPKVPASAPLRHRLLLHVVFALWSQNLTPMSIIRAVESVHERLFGFANDADDLYERRSNSATRSPGQRLARFFIESRFSAYSEAERDVVVRYFYEISMAPGSGEYALNTVLEPGGYARRPLGERLGELRDVPVDFVYGIRDWMDWRHSERASERMNVPIEIHRVQHSGHNIHVDNPSDFNQLVSLLCLKHINTHKHSKQSSSNAEESKT